MITKLRNMFFYNTDTETLSRTTDKGIDEEIEALDKEILESELLDEESSPSEKLDTLDKTEERTDENIEETQSEDADKSEVDEKVIEDSKPTDKKDSDTLTEESKPTEKDSDTLENQDNYGVITKELIKSFPEDQQKTLLRYEGKPFSEALKTIVHQKSQIGKLSSRKNLETKPENPYPDPVKEPVEADKIKEQLINSRMQNLYSDYPKDEYEWNELQSSNYPKAHRYAAERESLAKSINEAYNSAIYAQNHSHELNDLAINEASGQIAESLKADGLDIMKDFGIDPKNAEAVNNFMDSMLLNGDKLDLDVFETWENDKGETVLKYGVPIIKQDALLKKFEHQYGPHVKLKIKENAFLKGMEAARNTKVAPSFSGAKTVVRKSPKTPMPQSIEELNKAIEESENSNNY